METYESNTTRICNLMLAIQENPENTQAAIARALELEPSYISQMVNQHRRIGGRMARKIEKKLGKPVGWLDTPQPELWLQRGIQIPPKDGDEARKREHLHNQIAKLDAADVTMITSLVESLLAKKR